MRHEKRGDSERQRIIEFQKHFQPAAVSVRQIEGVVMEHMKNKRCYYWPSRAPVGPIFILLRDTI